MEYSINALRGKVQLYLRRDISKQALGQWAAQAYYDALKGGYLETEKIVMYPFLKKLSSIDVARREADDIFPCEEQEVRNIWNILNGITDFDFCIEMGLPKQGKTLLSQSSLTNRTYRNALAEKYGLLRADAEENIGDILRIVQEGADPCGLSKDTLFDMLEHNLIDLAKAVSHGYSENSEQIGITRLYADKSSRKTAEKKLIQYLEAYLGYQNFVVLISFKKGTASLSLIV